KVEDEYWEVRKNTGILDLSHLGRLTVTGRDRSSFLHGLLTNDITNLKEYQGTRACLLTPKARVLADMHVHNLSDRLLLDTDESPSSRLKSTLDQFIVTEDVRIEDSTDGLLLLSLQGPKAADMIRQVLRTDVSTLPRNANQALGPSVIINHDRTGQGGYDIVIPRNESESVWQAFLLQGVQPVGTDALDILRLEAALPKYGVDLDENTLVLEAGLKDAISFNKGCYMGQETVARATFIGRVNRRLAQIHAKASHGLGSGARLFGDNKEAGVVTSSVYSPALSGVVGLGYVQKDFAKEGTQIEIVTANEERFSATVTKLV
ncbi:MAG TPA: glycine cleavage T C-terminal barrel domain-containing protein, partial [Dongiaceae bacterium]|nr:glycine cleavage T C-terminal barrel domain-containing protein [Dongiaceae bacterium]